MVLFCHNKYQLYQYWFLNFHHLIGWKKGFLRLHSDRKKLFGWLENTVFQDLIFAEKRRIMLIG